MGILTGAAYLESLRDGRDIRIDGVRVADVTRDPRFAGGAATMAALYQMQHAPDLQSRLTYASPDTGDLVGLSFIEPRTQDDLARRRDMIKTWMDATCGMFGRSPDFMNVHVTAIASAWASVSGARSTRLTPRMPTACCATPTLRCSSTSARIRPSA